MKVIDGKNPVSFPSLLGAWEERGFTLGPEAAAATVLQWQPISWMNVQQGSGDQRAARLFAAIRDELKGNLYCCDLQNLLFVFLFVFSIAPYGPLRNKSE